jgi:hypothetical protein
MKDLRGVWRTRPTQLFSRTGWGVVVLVEVPINFRSILEGTVRANGTPKVSLVRRRCHVGMIDTTVYETRV